MFMCFVDILFSKIKLKNFGVTIHRTGPHWAGKDWLFHFDDELKGVRRANCPQLTKEMNPSRRSWWVVDGRIQCGI